jgi:ABC-2 type transport system permease protein
MAIEKGDTMKRFWIFFITDFKSWRKKPISTIAGFLPPLLLLVIYGIMFGSGRTAFPVAVINHDSGPYGEMLIETMAEVKSPLEDFYYVPLKLSEAEAWERYDTFKILGVWIIPSDFSRRLLAGEHPQIDVYFRNYNDDRAKNQRLYPTEILWRFYEKMEADPGLKFSSPPIRLREEYPQERIVGWFPFIGVALALLGSTMAGMITILALSQEEQLADITADIGLAPRSLIPFLLSKLAFALLMALLSTTLVLLALSVWTGMNMSAYIWVVWLLAGLVALFWAGLALILSFLSGRALGSSIIVVAIGLIVFFIAGGTEPVRYSSGNLWWLIRLFPNAYAVDPLRDAVLFNTIPANWTQIILTLILFAAVSLSAGFFVAQRQLRKSLAR